MANPATLTARYDESGAHGADDDGARVPWWSFTKTALAAAAMQLVAAGRLDLDAQIGGRAYTLRQLLQHTAGVPNYGNDPAYRSAVANGEEPWTVAELLRRSGGERQMFEPGTDWSYSNIGYLHVRQIIETATAETIDVALKRLVFDRIGLGGVGLARVPSDLDDTACGNHTHYHPGWVYHGLLVGTPRDAVWFLHALLTGLVIPTELVRAMTSCHEIGGALDGRPWLNTGYGLGLMIGRMEKAGLAMGHSGVGPDSVAAVYHLPELEPPRTVAAFSQGSDEGANEFQALGAAF